MPRKMSPASLRAVPVNGEVRPEYSIVASPIGCPFTELTIRPEIGPLSRLPQSRCPAHTTKNMASVTLFDT